MLFNLTHCLASQCRTDWSARTDPSKTKIHIPFHACDMAGASAWGRGRDSEHQRHPSDSKLLASVCWCSSFDFARAILVLLQVRLLMSILNGCGTNQYFRKDIPVQIHIWGRQCRRDCETCSFYFPNGFNYLNQPLFQRISLFVLLTHCFQELSRQPPQLYFLLLDMYFRWL